MSVPPNFRLKAQSDHFMLVPFWICIVTQLHRVQTILQSLLCSRMMLLLHMVTIGDHDHSRTGHATCLSCVRFADSIQLLSVAEGQESAV